MKAIQKAITIEQAKKLPTKRLLDYYKKIPRVQPVYCDNIIECKDCGGCFLYPFNSTEEVDEHRKQIKNLLDERENVN